MKKLVSIFIFNLIAIVGGYANTKIIKLDESHSIEFVAIQSNESTNSTENNLFRNAQLVNEENNGSKYFLDEIPNYLISLNQQFYFGKGIETTMVKYNGDSLIFNGQPQILIKGLPSGE
ncbi:MAG: hypothetical protein P8L23_05310, partial [Flavobacteriales bacterium]|nr:hypothetical protein [Flavobacteriales bacterium]